MVPPYSAPFPRNVRVSFRGRRILKSFLDISVPVFWSVDCSDRDRPSALRIHLNHLLLGIQGSIMWSIGIAHAYVLTEGSLLKLWTVVSSCILFLCTNSLEDVERLTGTDDAARDLRVPVGLLDLLHVVHEEQLWRHLGNTTSILTFLVIQLNS